MQFSVLGPMCVTENGEDRTPSAPKHRQMLALLLMNANHVVSMAQFVEELWEYSPPPSAVAAVHTYVMQLRRILQGTGPATATACRLVTRDQGYVLTVQDGELDLHAYERQVRAGQGRPRRRQPGGRRPPDPQGPRLVERTGTRGRTGRAAAAGRPRGHGTGPAGGHSPAGPRRAAAGPPPPAARRALRARPPGPRQRAAHRPADAGPVPVGPAGRRARRVPPAAPHPARGARNLPGPGHPPAHHRHPGRPPRLEPPTEGELRLSLDAVDRLRRRPVGQPRTGTADWSEARPVLLGA